MTAFRAKLIHSGPKAILMLPDRSKVAGIPLGETPVHYAGEPFTFRFAKIAVNVATPVGGGANCLTTILRSMFGPTAGQPGTKHHVEFSRDDAGDWHVSPVHPDELRRAA